MEDTPPKPELDASEAHDLVAQVLGVGATDGGIESDFEIPGIDIIHRIARGGMGEVYFASLHENGDEVAVKVLNPISESDPLSVERFIREGKTMDRLNHPNLLKIRGRGSLPDGRPYLITDYAEAGTLNDILRKEGVLEEATILQYLKELCAGLAEVHAAGLVHRDIKPSNLLIDGDGHIIVADFGLAKGLQLELTELTLSGTSLGTANYMAPEQGVPGATIDARADIFATGVVLYTMLTGELPKGQFKPPSSFGRKREWDRIVGACLASAPEERFGNATELGKELDKFGTEFPGRRKLLITGVGVAVALSAGGYFAFANRRDRLPSDWVDLLPKLEISSPWIREENGQLVCSEQVKSAAIFADFDTAENYELRCTWRRLEGIASLSVFLPTARGTASFEMGAWRKDLAGIQSIDGVTVVEPGSHSIQHEFLNDVDYNITVKVSPEMIIYSVGESIEHEVNIMGKSLEIVDSWENIRRTSIGFGAWQCRAVFSKLEYRSN